MPTLLNATSSPRRDGGDDASGKSSTEEKSSGSSRLDVNARANILFQAHLTTAGQKAPKGFSPKVIRKAALCSPRHFKEERATFKSVGLDVPTKTRADGKRTSRREVQDVYVTKKKQSMLATVKTRAPMVEVVVKQRAKEKELEERASEYDQKCVCATTTCGV